MSRRLSSPVVRAAPQDGGIGGEALAHLDESANQIDAHRAGARAVEDIRSHESAVLGEGARQDGRELQTREVVTICDHLQFLGGGYPFLHFSGH